MSHSCWWFIVDTSQLYIVLCRSFGLFLWQPSKILLTENGQNMLWYVMKPHQIVFTLVIYRFRIVDGSSDYLQLTIFMLKKPGTKFYVKLYKIIIIKCILLFPKYMKNVLSLAMISVICWDLVNYLEWRHLVNVGHTESSTALKNVNKRATKWAHVVHFHILKMAMIAILIVLKFKHQTSLVSNNYDRCVMTWASYQIRKIAVCACVGNAGDV